MTNKELTPEELKNEIMARFKATESGFGNMTNREKKLVALSAQIAKEYAAEAVEDYKTKSENFINSVVELHPIINTGNDKELKVYNALHELKSLNQNPDK